MTQCKLHTMRVDYLARMSKSAMRKRLLEASKKCLDVFRADLSTFHMSTADARAVRDMSEKLARISMKLK